FDNAILRKQIPHDIYKSTMVLSDFNYDGNVDILYLLRELFNCENHNALFMHKKRPGKSRVLSEIDSKASGSLSDAFSRSS
ncbi:MAG: hypothetical protein IJM08_04755, partial [Firmicutes bacterium]|nr:hypothetical protein [Bacillota bacterium]